MSLACGMASLWCEPAHRDGELLLQAYDDGALALGLVGQGAGKRVGADVGCDDAKRPAIEARLDVEARFA